MNGSTMLAALAWGLLASCGAPPEKDGSDMETLKAKILAKDPEAPLEARRLGSRAAPLLETLSRHEDAGVRRIALLSFREVGGAAAVRVFLRGLTDPDPQTAAAAVGGFGATFEPNHARELLAAYDQAPDPAARREIALFLGRSDSVDLDQFRKRQDAERDPLAQEGVAAGLARLGDKDAREDFIRRLLASKERDRLGLLDLAAGIGQSWLLKPLVSLLDDQSVLVTRGVDARPDLTLALRTSDIVVRLAATISKKGFSFPTDAERNYTSSEVDEVRRFLKGLP